jgi:16S rRNA U516 pseudouridylate synthase RsuA-like enzyme
MMRELGHATERPTLTHAIGKSELMRLNRFIANAGICSRREADTFITAGVVKVNGQVVTELGSKVSPVDEVRFDDRIIRPERKVYVLLNKPKDVITSTDDPHAEHTVMDLVKDAVGIEIHSGRHRVVRRIFEQLGYRVKALDRVTFAGLTKKNIPRGKWRLLTPREVSYLKMK